MKKTFISLTLLALCSAAVASPIQDKLNAYNALRANKPSTPVLDAGLLLRVQPGAPSSGANSANSCAICGITTPAQERTRVDAALPSTNQSTATAPTASVSLLTIVPPGLGAVPAEIVRTSSGTGAAWLPPDPTVDLRFADYETQLKYYETQYNVGVVNIINAYMNPVTGRLDQKRVEVLDAVERDMDTYKKANPNATLVQQANMEASLIELHGGAIATLTTQYEREIKTARENFDGQAEYLRYSMENASQGGDGA